MGLWDFLGGSTPAGIAGSAAKELATGVFDGIDKLIRDFKLPPEAQIAYEQFKSEQITKLATLAASDMSSARQMEILTKSRMPALLAGFYTIAFIGSSTGLLVVSFLYPEVSLNSFQAGMVGAIWGALAKEAGLGSSFYLGSSVGSDLKNDSINSMANTISNQAAAPRT